jgi:acyl-CoA reductase-like NAD-dependent aldehyde dehydrogenase
VHQRAATADGDVVRGDWEERGSEAADGGNGWMVAHYEGWFHEPTVFGDCSAKMRVAQEEIFGPVVSLIPFESFDEAIEIANGVPYGLSASIYTKNVNQAFAAMRDIYTGYRICERADDWSGDPSCRLAERSRRERSSRGGDCGD